MKDKKNIWAVVAVSDKAKDIAKKLAKQSGKNMGPWLEQVIYNQENLHNAGEILKEDEPLRFDSIHEKLDDITKQMVNISVQIYEVNKKIEKKSFWSRFS